MANKKTVYLMYPQKKGTIAPELYGHFTEHLGSVIYGGIWVGKDSDIPNIKGFRKDIIEKLRAINAPVVRWPGGCFTESYNWRDGIGENRPVRRSWWTRFDKRYESNQVGTHEFMDFCEAVGAKAYFAINMAGMAPQDALDWMDYCLSPQGTTTAALEREKNGHPEPFAIPYWGVGNENYGGGGNMAVQYYADEFRKYSVILKNAFFKTKIVACGSDVMDFDWTDGLMWGTKNALYQWPMDGFGMHYYWKGENSLDFSEEEWTGLIGDAAKMEDIIERNWHIICGHGMQDTFKLVIDEWGTWNKELCGPSNKNKLLEQQVTMRDAMITAVVLNIFNRHCDKILMANAAQLVNCLHSLFLADEDKCITTPIYHVFDMYQEHMGGEAIEVTVTDNEDFASSVTISASVKDGKTLLTVGNISCKEDVEISLESVGVQLPKNAKGTLLVASDIRDCNTFESPNTVTTAEVELDLTKPVVIPKAGILAVRF